MNVQFDWQAGDEQGQWETIATIKRHTAFRVSRRVWCTLLLTAIVLTVGGMLGVRYRYRVALRHLTSDLQAAIDLETRALKQRDRGLFMAQQDEARRDWYDWQVVRFLMYHNLRDPSGSAPDPESAPIIYTALWAPGPHPKVTRVQLHGNVAWVEVVEGLPPVRHARFYRQTNYGWKHTAPCSEFWGEPVEHRYDSVIVRAQQYDLAHVEPLVEHLVRGVDEASAALGYTAKRRLEVDFVLQDSPNWAPVLQEGRLILPSPWLTGIPVEGAWNSEYLDTLDGWAAYWVVSQYLQSAGGRSSNAVL
jgi:hypothetical protein